MHARCAGLPTHARFRSPHQDRGMPSGRTHSLRCRTTPGRPGATCQSPPARQYHRLLFSMLVVPGGADFTDQNTRHLAVVCAHAVGGHLRLVPHCHAVAMHSGSVKSCRHAAKTRGSMGPAPAARSASWGVPKPTASAGWDAMKAIMMKWGLPAYLLCAVSGIERQVPKM